MADPRDYPVVPGASSGASGGYGRPPVELDAEPNPYADIFNAILEDVRGGPFGGDYSANLGTIYDFLLRPPGETFAPIERRSSPGEAIAARFPERPEGSLANIGTELVLGAAEPGPSEWLRALSMTLPRPLLRALGSVTRAVDGSGNPMRFLHGTPWAYDLPDPGAVNNTYFGKARYGTAGHTASELSGGWRSAESDLGWQVPPVHRIEDARGNAWVADPNLELTTARYSGDIVDHAGDATHFGGTLAPNVRGEFYDVRNPLDFEQEISFEDAEQLIHKIMGSGPRTTKAVSGLSRRFQGRPSTVGDVLREIDRQIRPFTYYGQDGAVRHASNAAYEAGFDGIVSRARDVAGTPGGRGAIQWAIPSTDQIIPAGSIPDALVALERRGIIEAPPWQRLFDAATSKDPIRLMQELLFLEGR